MTDIILNILGVICLTISGIYVWSKLLTRKIDFRNYKFYLAVLFLSLISIINYSSVNEMIRIVFIILIMAYIIKFIFTVSLKEGIVTAFFSQIINLLPEFIYSIILIFVFNIKINLEKYPAILLFGADLFVSLGSIILIRFKFINKIYNYIKNVVIKLKTKTILICLLPIIFIFNAYLSTIYYEINTFLLILLNNISIYLVIIIIFILLKKENDYLKISDKYNTTLNSLKEYEDILDKYKVSNHENKNQLLTIRNMVADKNKKVAKYIDEVVKNKIKDDERIMQEVSIIPAGGLRGLVYSKILYMKENKIEYELNISKDIRTVDLINKLDDSDILDICQVIGVYIDNAIQAVVDLKDKYVSIELYLEEYNLVFEISNYYEGKLELDKLDQKGYTTKGSGHGYGLTLTKQIIDNNKKLKNEKKLSKDFFTQVLKIKMK